MLTRYSQCLQKIQLERIQTTKTVPWAVFYCLLYCNCKGKLNCWYQFKEWMIHSTWTLMKNLENLKIVDLEIYQRILNLWKRGGEWIRIFFLFFYLIFFWIPSTWLWINYHYYNYYNVYKFTGFLYIKRTKIQPFLQSSLHIDFRSWALFWLCNKWKCFFHLCLFSQYSVRDFFTSCYTIFPTYFVIFFTFSRFLFTFYHTVIFFFPFYQY